MYDIKYHSADLSDKKFLITGGAGFIGSNLVEYLLKHDAGLVRVLDNLSTGFKRNIEPFLSHENFEFVEGDIRDFETCKRATEGIDFVSHQAALGSVPRSINDPLTTNDVNITGHLNMLYASSEHNVKRFVYAASSSTYGDSKILPKVEENIGKPLSPYAVTKYVNELYANLFSQVYNIEVIGLRYFNVFGPKQNPKGAYAAVIPLFIDKVLNDESPMINGDGTQTRDFTFVENVIQANVLAFENIQEDATNQVYNVGCGSTTDLNALIDMINHILDKDIKPSFREERQGDVKNSLADISKIGNLLGFEPKFSIEDGLKITVDYFNQISINSKMK